MTIATLAVSVIVAIFASITAPLILAHRTKKMHREDREAAWARQDEVSRRLIATDGKLDVIHELVNSGMTAAMQAELDALVTSRALMQEVVDLKRAQGRTPSPDALAAIQAAEAKINEAGARIADRNRQAAAIADQRREGLR